MKILHLDVNHPLLIQQLNELGFINHEDYSSSKNEIESKIDAYDGIIIRSRFNLDRAFLDKAKNLKFIGRVGAGLENIDRSYAEQKGIALIAAPEGNRNAVAEHCLGMLLALFNNLKKADEDIGFGQWLREENRGIELDGKTVGLVGYGNTGKAFAKKLKGFEVDVMFHDVLEGLEDQNARHVSLDHLQKHADVLSLHVPLTELTLNMVDTAFINAFQKPFWLLNSSRGKNVVTSDLVSAMKSGKILGAGLDVLEYESGSFEDLFSSEDIPEAFQYLINAKHVILTPHVAGWTKESKVKLAQTIVNKIKAKFC
ncbi:MAG: 2-hydroxyacid dehydrogenase [Bacteroidia bacterium]|nr:2-hydroxyacid dehydrogenase [Bacteroidia bacterium]NND51615.1 hydroxyacid dehydrogenase [Flavobacteriaceae bacterium]